MTMDTSATTALSTVISLALLWILARLYRKHRIDVLRHNMFVLRAELFDLARHGELAFDSPVYVGLRTTINGFLRYAERIGFLQTFLTHRALKKVPADSNIMWWERQWQQELERVPVEARAKLMSIKDRMNYALFRHLMLSSPLMVATVIPFLLLTVIEHVSKRFVWRWAKGMYEWCESGFAHAISRPLDAMAYRVGHVGHAGHAGQVGQLGV